MRHSAASAVVWALAVACLAGPAHGQSTVREIADRILNDRLEAAERSQWVQQHLDRAVPLVAALVDDLPRDEAEEYRRIPWIWQVSIQAARRNDGPQLVELLRVSLPERGGELRDWQAVVLGGGLINGVSQRGVWPKARFAELLSDDEALRERWNWSLQQALAMSDNERVRSGTRYDALRMIALLDWPQPQVTLNKYLAQGTHVELQMGAVSGYVDVDRPEAIRALMDSLTYLPSPNRELALEGMLRGENRALALLEAIRGGQVDRGRLDANFLQKLRTHDSERVRVAAAQIVP